ncbi:MAG TPA: hypothetical protein VFD41_10205 [Actinomycetales bacterium]|nr:hypothetical protein [Actinomycetales bacterium]
MKRITALAVAGAVGAVLVGGPALAADVPNITVDDDRHDRRADRITEALSGLVDDGTITSEQAEAVAATLSERGRPGCATSGVRAWTPPPGPWV